MRLSDVKGERTMDVIAEIIEPITDIASDPNIMELFGRKTPPEGMTAKEFALKRLRSGLPALMKDHKKSFIAIIAAINGVDADKYTKNLNLAMLMKDIVDLLTDDIFIGLFT